MARIRLPLAMSLVALAPTASLAFVTTATPALFADRIQLALRDSNTRHVPLRSRRCCGRRLVLRASVKPDVGDTASVISEMEDWARAITPEVHVKRSSNYVVSTGTTLPEVFFDFWKAVSGIIDEHRATSESRSFQKLVMFVAPFCEELKDYQTMEHAHLLLQQSANDGGCDDFGQNVIFGPYHPNFRHRPRPKEARMASRHTPHPAFSIHAIYRAGGLKSLASLQAATGTTGTGGATSRPGFPGPGVSSMGTGETDGATGKRRRKRREWAASTRSSLEAVYKMAASYGEEDKVIGSSGGRQHPLAGKGVPESSLEIMQNTQAWLKGVLKDAAESDAAAAMQLKTAGAGKSMSPLSTASFNPLTSGAGGNRHPAAHGGRLTAFKPPTAAEAAAAVAAAAAEEEETEAASGGTLAAGMMASQEITPRNRPAAPRFTAAAGGLKHAFAQAAERVTVREEARRVGIVKEKEEAKGQKQEEEAEEEAVVVVGTGKEGEGAWEGGGAGGVSMPGKELVKRMKDISQYIVARSETPEEAYCDAWEVIMEMADRAASRGCSVPTEDYTSNSVPCYGALMVTPDLATYSSDAFFRFKDTLNRGLKHLPMEHDISVEAFHPEAVSDSSPLDHRFTRSPFPTLHICYHGLRTRSTTLHPKARTSPRSVSSKAQSVASTVQPVANKERTTTDSNSSGGCSGVDGGVVGSEGGSENDEDEGEEGEERLE